MSLQVEKLEKNMAKLTVEVPAEQFVEAIGHAYNKNKSKFNVPGFRKGKVPQAMIEKMYGPEVFYEEAANEVISATYGDAAKESGLDIVSRPAVDLVQIEKGKNFIYTAEVAVKPEVTLGQYKGVEVEKASAEVTDEDVEKELKKTQEQNPDGSYETIAADFRKYPCVEDSIADHSAYLLGAKNGERLRYEGLKGCADYKKAVQIIKDGGYATSLTYAEKLCSIIEKWNLTQYDAKDSCDGEVVRWYRVRKNWTDAKSQKGAFKILENAKKCADENPGYKVFDADGNAVYESKAADVPFLVKVSILDLNIRKGPGTDYGKTGKFTGAGVFTILEVKDGKGSSAGWGRLKSGAGWISLDYAWRI